MRSRQKYLGSGFMQSSASTGGIRTPSTRTPSTMLSRYLIAMIGLIFFSNCDSDSKSIEGDPPVSQPDGAENQATGEQPDPGEEDPGQDNPDQPMPDQPNEISYPIDDVTTDDTWQWVADVPGAQCGRPMADGSPNTTGLGVNFNANSDTLLVYFQFGGACWTKENCANELSITPAELQDPNATIEVGALNLEGYKEAHFIADIDSPLEAPMTPAILLKALPSITVFGQSFDIDDEQVISPFADAQMAFFPYCTGDVFVGTKAEAGKTGIVHAGAKNIDAYIAQLKHFFAPPKAGHVPPKDIYLVGSSAGGFGAIVNAEKFIEAFPNAHINVISDSGVILERTLSASARTAVDNDIRNTWGVASPEDCENCDNSFFEVIPHLAAKYPDKLSYTLLSYQNDRIIEQFFEYQYRCERAESLATLFNETDIDGASSRDYPNIYHASSANPGHTMLDFLYLPLKGAVESTIATLPAPFNSTDFTTVLGLAGLPQGIIDFIDSAEDPFTDITDENNNLRSWLTRFRSPSLRTNIGALDDPLTVCP